MSIDPVILNRKYRLCSLHFEDKMFSNYQKNRIKSDAIPIIFQHLAEEVPIVEHVQIPLNDIGIIDNTPSCSTFDSDLAAINISVTMSDASTSSEVEMSSTGVQTPKYLSANTPRKLKLHEKLAEQIQLKKESEEKEKDLSNKVNTLRLQLAERYSVDYCLKILTKRLKHSMDKYKDLQVEYDELKMISEKVRADLDNAKDEFLEKIMHMQMEHGKQLLAIECRLKRTKANLEENEAHLARVTGATSADTSIAMAMNAKTEALLDKKNRQIVKLWNDLATMKQNYNKACTLFKISLRDAGVQGYDDSVLELVPADDKHEYFENL